MVCEWCLFGRLASSSERPVTNRRDIIKRTNMFTNSTKDNHGHGPHDQVLALVIEGREYKWHQQYITGAEIKKLGMLPSDSKILLAIKKPWDDELVEDDIRVDLAREG